jgi:hypothetical protein
MKYLSNASARNFYFLIFIFYFLGACAKHESIDLKCGDHTLAGSVGAEVAEVRIDDGIVRIMPLFAIFTNEIVAEYAPQYVSNPKTATTTRSYINMTADDKKIELTAYARHGKTIGYELEFGGKKLQCNFISNKN